MGQAASSRESEKSRQPLNESESQRKKEDLPCFPENKTVSYINFCSQRYPRSYFQGMSYFSEMKIALLSVDALLSGRSYYRGDALYYNERQNSPHCNCKKCNYYKKSTVALAVVGSGLIIAVIVQAALLSGRSSTALGPACPNGWIGYQGKCYYFSEAKGNWIYSHRHCSSLSASLAAIDGGQEMDFMLRYKGEFDHWISLWRDPGQPWKWANGNKLNNPFPITADGDCVYLNDLSGLSSLPCTSEKYWICTKPDAFTQAQEAAAEGG